MISNNLTNCFKDKQVKHWFISAALQNLRMCQYVRNRFTSLK